MLNTETGSRPIDAQWLSGRASGGKRDRYLGASPRGGGLNGGVLREVVGDLVGLSPVAAAEAALRPGDWGWTGSMAFPGRPPASAGATPAPAIAARKRAVFSRASSWSTE